MIKIFVTGDNHIGLKYANYEKSEFLKGERITAFENMVNTANSEDCGLFVITGDLFENTYSVSKKDVQKLMDILTKFKGIVVILPGNHDYYDEDVQIWKFVKDVIKNMDNIMLVTEYRPYQLEVNGEAVAIYPAHCTTLHSELKENNLGWIKEENIISDNTYRIGVAHGAVEGETIDREGLYFLMSRQELESIPMDLWLIGHTHVPFPKNLTGEFNACDKVLNPGTHLQTDVNCNTEGLSFIVCLDEGKKVKAKKVVSGTVRFFRKNIKLEAGKMETFLESELKAMPDNSVVDIRFSGTITDSEYENRHEIIENKLSRFVEYEYNDTELSKLITKELIDKEFVETSFSASLLNALIEEPKEAQLAYELLKTLKEEGK